MRLAYFAVFLLGSSTAIASSPSLGAIRPVGGQRGTEVEISLIGARLGDAQELLFSQPGIETISLTKVADNQVKAKLKIAANCTLGLHDLRLRTATGVSELRTFSVGPYKEVSEVEPNNDFLKPQVIAMNNTVNGVAENEDVDFYVIEAKKGQRISAEVEGIRLGQTQFDPYVAIMDAKRFELSSSDDSALIWQDAFASVIAPADGMYIIQVRESAYAGNGACLYRLHVGEFPRFSATVPMGGKAGEKVSVRWVGDVAGEKTTETVLPGKPDPLFGLFAQDEKGISPYPNLFRVSSFGNVIEKEPNDSQQDATPFVPPIGLNGVIDKSNDTDCYTFKATKGQTYDVKVFARSLRSPLDPVLYISKKGQGAFAGNDDQNGPDSYIRFTADDNVDYVLHIVDHLKKGGPDYAYRIEVTPVSPKLTLSATPESIFRGTPAINVAIPKGNRQAILINATRADFAGELKVALDNLPPGVEAQGNIMAGNLSTFPILFTAKPDAPLSGRLVKVQGTPSDAKIKLDSSDFAHVIELVNGQNNQSFWSRTTDSLAVAVTEESPYSIEIIEPKVPIVRGGSMGLRVKAIRKEGFKAAIAVNLPWNPPGISSSGGVAIPEGQNEAVIPVNADGGAEIKTWKIVVNGYSGIASGPIMVSSQMANLSVAAPFVQLGFQNAATEQGKETDVLVKVTKLADFPGEATVTVIGLPNKAVTDVKKITKDTPEVVFHVKIDPTTPAGNHQNLFCQVIVMQNDEPIVHNIGGFALRVDVPIPPKVNAPAPVAAKPVAAPPPPPAGQPVKVLSRLEKLRLEQQEKAKAAGSKP